MTVVRTGDPLSDLPLHTDNVREISMSEGSHSRTKYLINNRWLSDASLLVGFEDKVKLIPVHTQLLRPASEPFDKMFGEDWKRNAPVRIPDFDATVVYSMLRWIYCDEVVYLDADLLSLLRLASVYFLKPLVKLLTEKVCLTLETVWSMLSFSMEFGNEDLLRKCQTFVVPLTHDVIFSARFLKAPPDVVKAITMMKVLDISEVQLYERCMEWAKEECGRRKKEPTAGNMRSCMQSFVQNIAFSSMTMEELAMISRSGILSPQERLLIYDSMGDKSVDSPFRAKKRERPATLSCPHQRQGYRGQYLCHGGNRCHNCTCLDFRNSSYENWSQNPCHGPCKGDMSTHL